MADDVLPFPAKKIDVGYDTYEGDFRIDFVLHKDSVNVSAGLAKGLGPRYGMSPIPGHSDTETPGAGQLNCIMRSELNSGNGMRNRTRIFGIVPLKISNISDITTKKNHYLFITAGGLWSDNTKSAISAVFSGITEAFSPDISKGLPEQTGTLNGTSSSTSDPYAVILNRLYRRASTPAGTNAADVLAALQIESTRNFASIASIIVPSRPQPNAWIVGSNTGVGPLSATDPGNIRLLSSDTYTDTFVALFGAQSMLVLQAFKPQVKPVNIWAVRTDLATAKTLWLEKQYVYADVLFDGTIYKSVFLDSASGDDPDIQLDTIAATSTIDPLDHVADVTNPQEFSFLVNDNDLTCDNGYQMVCVAAKKPFAFFVSDWERSPNGNNVCLIDLRRQNHAPRTVRTLLPGTGTSTFYSEDAVQKPTCFSRWPAFVTATPTVTDAASAYDGAIHVTLGAANSGILRKNMVYEITYSVYDKRLNFETNVGEPAKIQTGADDFIAVSLYRDSKTGGTSGTVFDQMTPRSLNNIVHTISRSFTTVPTYGQYFQFGKINHLEFRFYYRALGSYEWLPALFIDAAKYLFYPNHQVLWACQGTAVGTVGGQTGGFNDYGELPDEPYTCCVAFKGRMFWLSPQNMHYSRQNNPIAYPINNTFSAPSGEFRGGIVHQFRGESDLQSQLIVFGSKEAFFGDFTGQPLLASVQVSPDNIAEFPIDGSDFVLESLTTNTAFSYRAAVVADGDLYYWGPQGVFLREGSLKPVKVSGNIEPELATLYDSELIDQIACVFDDQTREITWMYPPKTADAAYPTHGIIYNIDSHEFYPAKFAGKVDAIQKITVEDSDSPVVANSDRTLIFSREAADDTIQRAWFFDYLSKCGDIYPGKEMMVKSFTTPTAGRRTFTLAAGYDAALLGTLVAGNLIGVPFAREYATSLTDADPFIGEVVSVNSGAGTITISLPDGVDFDATASLAHAQYFPIYAEPVHAFPYHLLSHYWAPGGLRKFWFFLYLHCLFRLDPLLPCPEEQQIDLSFKTIFNTAFHSRSPGFYEDTLTLKDNSDGNYQVYKALNQSHAFAQAIKFAMSGNHFAGSWVLQYLELLGQDQTHDQIKVFEE